MGGSVQLAVVGLALASPTQVPIRTISIIIKTIHIIILIIVIIIIVISIIIIIIIVIVIIIYITYSFFIVVVVLTGAILKPAVNDVDVVILDHEPTSKVDTKDPPISSFFYVPFKLSSLTNST